MGEKSGALYFGLDGGGSGSRAALCDVDRRIVVRAEGGPANISTDFSSAMDVILDLIRQVCQAAGVSANDTHIKAAHLGLAGATSTELAARVERALPFVNAQVSEDTLTTVAGALAFQDGSVAAIGTGSFIARQSNCALTTLGGWGLHAGDDASGAWLGQNLIRAVLHAHDGLREASPLAKECLSDFRGSPHEIADFCRNADADALSRFAPRIADAAEHGDTIATDLMQRGAQYIENALSAIGHEPGEPVCLTGGVGPRYAQWLPDFIRSDLAEPDGTSLDGALRLAIRAAKDRGA